jgi:hypothetical protein
LAYARLCLTWLASRFDMSVFLRAETKELYLASYSQDDPGGSTAMGGLGSCRWFSVLDRGITESPQGAFDRLF